MGLISSYEGACQIGYFYFPGTKTHTKAIRPGLDSVKLLKIRDLAIVKLQIMKLDNEERCLILSPMNPLLREWYDVNDVMANGGLAIFQALADNKFSISSQKGIFHELKGNNQLKYYFKTIDPSTVSSPGYVEILTSENSIEITEIDRSTLDYVQEVYSKFLKESYEKLNLKKETSHKSSGCTIM